MLIRLPRRPIRRFTAPATTFVTAAFAATCLYVTAITLHRSHIPTSGSHPSIPGSDGAPSRLQNYTQLGEPPNSRSSKGRDQHEGEGSYMGGEPSPYPLVDLLRRDPGLRIGRAGDGRARQNQIPAHKTGFRVALSTSPPHTGRAPRLAIATAAGAAGGTTIDSDDDGIPDLLERALGGDPDTPSQRSATPPHLPLLPTVAIGEDTVLAGFRHLEITYRTLAGAQLVSPQDAFDLYHQIDDLRYIPEISRDGGHTWLRGRQHIVPIGDPTPNGDGTQSVTMGAIPEAPAPPAPFEPDPPPPESLNRLVLARLCIERAAGDGG